MYDTVKFWIGRTRDTPDILQYLNDCKIQTDTETGEMKEFGRLHGLKVSVHPAGISISGSLSRVLYENNIYALNRRSARQALEKLSDSLHLSMDEAKVNGLEFGQTYVMKHPVNAYLLRLGDMPRLSRFCLETSLYYRHRGKCPEREFAFYDKKADAMAKGMTLPPMFEDTDLLKYEMRFPNKLSRQLGCTVTGRNLYDRDFYRQMVERYQSSYYSIHKRKRMKTDIRQEIKTVSDAFNILVARLISQTDPAQITEFVEDLKAENVFEDKKYYTRLKARIKDVSEKAGIMESDELLHELDDAVRNAGAYI